MGTKGAHVRPVFHGRLRWGQRTPFVNNPSTTPDPKNTPNSTKPNVFFNPNIRSYRLQNDGTKRISTVKISRRPAIISIAITHLPRAGR